MCSLLYFTRKSELELNEHGDRGICVGTGGVGWALGLMAPVLPRCRERPRGSAAELLMSLLAPGPEHSPSTCQVAGKMNLGHFGLGVWEL